MKKSARLYNCARCYCQVVICRHCDRGHLYCADCSQPARTESLDRAKAKYQSSHQSRVKNADRQRRCRERQRKKVTDQGSLPVDASDLLRDEPIATENAEQQDLFTPKRVIHCHFCHGECDPFLRRSFLRLPSRYRRDTYS